MYTFLIGIIIGIVGTKLWEVKQAKGIRISKLEYLFGIMWLLWIAFSSVFVALSIGEGESRAASLGTLIFGGAALLAFLMFRYFYLKRRNVVSDLNTSVSE